MALMGSPLLCPVLSLFLVSVLYDAVSGDTGGWKPIKDVTDPAVVELGRFAVEKHNKDAGSALEFVRVVKGQTHKVDMGKFALTEHLLTITAKTGGSENNYEALVWDNPPQKFRQLMSFEGPLKTTSF